MESSFETFCKDHQIGCGEPADESKSKVCYWCYRGYHWATQHFKDKIRDSMKDLLSANQDMYYYKEKGDDSK